MADAYEIADAIEDLIYEMICRMRGDEDAQVSYVKSKLVKALQKEISE